MNFRTTLILLVLLAGALVFVLIVNRDKPADDATTTATKDDEKGKKVVDVAAEAIEKIVVRPGEGAAAGGRTLELVKADGRWTMTQPIAWPAVANEVSTIVAAITDARSTASVDLTPENAAATGLAKPRFRVELTDTAKKVHKVAIGQQTLGRLYVSVGDGPKTGLVLGGGAIAQRFGKGVDDLVAAVRDPKLTTLDSFKIRSVDIDQPGGRRVSARKAGEQWSVVVPETVAAETAEVTAIVSALTNLRADEFADPAAPTPAGAGFDRPRAVVTLSETAPGTQPTTGAATAGAGTGVTFTIGGPADLAGTQAWVKVSNPPVVARVALPTADVDRAAKASPLSLRDRKVMDLDPAAATAVTIAVSRPGEETKVTKLVKTTEQPTFGPALPPPASGPSATTVPATAPATVPSATQPATRPSAAASFLSPALALTGLMQVAATQPAATQPAAPSTQPATAVVPAATTQATTQPTTAAAAAPQAGPAVARWVIASAAKRDADEDAVRQLLESLHPLKATAFVAPAATRPATTPSTGPSTGPATNAAPTTYVLTITTRAADGTTTDHELRITDAGEPAKPVGTLDGLTFELDRGLLAKLTGTFVPPPPGSTPPAPPPGGGLPEGFDPSMFRQ